jgi:hypothetical protein
MFLLIGGPRAGQLVDELPGGYRVPPASSPDGDVSLFEDFIARKATWDSTVGARVTPIRRA